MQRSRRRATKRCSCGAFSQRAREEGYIYYIMEAFDQPWKARYQGAVELTGACTTWIASRSLRSSEPIVRIPQWQTLAAISIVLASLLVALLFVHSRTLDARGRSLLAIVVYAVTAAAVVDHLRTTRSSTLRCAAC
jgi:peptidoglycan/LPS O-acetylase OafA/YrhL